MIRGTAINNDGKEKAGYTAPSVNGQALAIKAALANAAVDPATVTYVETHGTATPLGDPIEIAALRQAFGGRSGRCALGALKANVGHLESAAGVAGVIKTAMALKHRTIPPTIHFSSPNPALDLGDGAFEVNTWLSEWTASSAPRRAGVSSFGIGGTNAHAVLEEAPDSPREEAARELELLPVSAKTESALRSACGNLAAWLERDDAPCLADAAYTLQVGRAAHEWRSFVVCSTAEEAVCALRRSGESGRRAEARPRRVVLVFGGLGSAAEGIPRQLYREHSAFREIVARCADLASRNLGIDLLRNGFVASTSSSAEPTDLPAATEAGRNVALLIRQYAWACLLRAWGIETAFVVGEGVGEYVAACVAGVLSLEDAMLLAHARGLDDASELARVARAVRPGRARIPFVSSVTGRVAPSDFASADYWIRQRETETDCTALARRLLDGAPKVLLAGGPDGDLGRRLRESVPGEKHLVPGACTGRVPPADGALTLEVLGALWSVGLHPDWLAFNRDRRARRTPLPTYPFERRPHWLDAKGRASRSGEMRTTSAAALPPCAASARSAVEGALSQIWRELFGLESVDVHDDFFALGGDSLLAVQLNTRTRSHFGRRLPLRELMMHPTISQIADLFSKN
jgi:acyl transferase domain-containing protein